MNSVGSATGLSCVGGGGGGGVSVTRNAVGIRQGYGLNALPCAVNSMDRQDARGVPPH